MIWLHTKWINHIKPFIVWAKICELEGIEGLKPKYKGGRLEKISKTDLHKLNQIIKEKKMKLLLIQVHDIILNEFDVDYSMKQVWEILTRKLNYNCKNTNVIPK